jgi:hypothetical protein
MVSAPKGNDPSRQFIKTNFGIACAIGFYERIAMSMLETPMASLY